MKEQRSCLQ